MLVLYADWPAVRGGEFNFATFSHMTTLRIRVILKQTTELVSQTEPVARQSIDQSALSSDVKQPIRLEPEWISHN